MQQTRHRNRGGLSLALVALGTITLATGNVARAADWTTTSGNNARTAASLEVGPTGPDLLWTVPLLSSTGTATFIEGSRAFLVEYVATSSAPSNAKCFKLDDGATLWTTPIPYGSATGGAGRCLGVDNGQVYVTRGRKIYALSSATGAIVWESVLEFVPRDDRRTALDLRHGSHVRAERRPDRRRVREHLPTACE